MAKQFNSDKYHYFVLLQEVAYKTETDGPNAGKTRPAIGSVGFRTYTDKSGAFGRKGAPVEYVVSRDGNGRDKGKYFTLDQAHNAFMVRDGDCDIYEKSMFDFIKNHPWCEGSPNGVYVNTPEGDRVQLDVKFRLMNTEADAEVALEASLNRSKAVLSASEIDDQTLVEVAAIGVGYHGNPDKMMRHKVVEWANKRPKDYFEVLNSGDRAVRALIRKAISENVFQVKHPLIYWDNRLIGTDEDAAVKSLMDDADLMTALNERVKLRTKGETPKKKK
jgi:hypothetical protein